MEKELLPPRQQSTL